MPTDPGAIRLQLRVVLVPVGRDEVAVQALLDSHGIDGGVVDVDLHVGTKPPKPPYTGIRDAGLGGAVSRSFRDTSANEQGLRIGQATDPEFVPGVGTPADVARRGVTTPRPIRDSPQA